MFPSIGKIFGLAYLQTSIAILAVAFSTVQSTSILKFNEIVSAAYTWKRKKQGYF